MGSGNGRLGDKERGRGLTDDMAGVSRGKTIARLLMDPLKELGEIAINRRNKEMGKRVRRLFIPEKKKVSEMTFIGNSIYYKMYKKLNLE